MRWAISSGCSMKFDFDSMTPDQQLAGRQLHPLEQRPFMAWRGFAASKEIAAGLAWNTCR